MTRKIVWFLSVGVLLLSGALGLYNGVTERSNSGTMLQKSVTLSVFIYGVLGIAGAVGMMARQRWSIPVVIGWGIACTYAASVATVAWSVDDSAWIGALAAGVSTSLIALTMAWNARTGLTARTALPRA